MNVTEVKECQIEQSGCSCHGNSENSEINIKKTIARYLVSFVLVLSVYILKLDGYVSFALYAAAYLLAGYDVLLYAAKNIINGSLFDENFLMSIASLGAFAIGEQTEAIAVLLFYGVGELMQEAAVTRSRKNIENLMDIRPDFANLVTMDGIKTVNPSEVKVGDIIIVKVGEKIPLDGNVVSGSSFIDTSALTGESVPVSVEKGDTVLSGSINTSGVLEIKVTKPFNESTVYKILELIQNASSKKAKSEKFITKFSKVYTPIVVGIAALIAVVPLVLGASDLGGWVYKALSFLIISCPCALVISIPIGFFAGIGGCAKRGILVKGGNYLEALNNVGTIVFDKTGTLTEGVFAVSEIIPADGHTEEEVLKFAAIAEQFSIHPIAKSILSRYAYPVEEATDIKEVAGLGIIAKTTLGTVFAGNERLLTENGIEPITAESSKTTVHIALNDVYLGYILISDNPRENAKETVKLLKVDEKKQIIMLTGDKLENAREVSAELGIDKYMAELLPYDKMSCLENIISSEKSSGQVMFVGDGINDAPVIARADIGVAMGGIGSDAAIEAADIVIMNDDIGKIKTAFVMAAKTRKIVMQNIFFAIGIKIAIMILALLGITSIWFAVFADVGVALLALLNAMRAA